MKRKPYQFWLKPEQEETAEKSSSSENLSPIDRAMSNLIKMKEATKLLRASAPTVRKYARLGHYKEYRFGEKLVFYNPDDPKILCVGNNPDRQNIYGAALGLYNSRIVKLINKKGQLKEFGCD